MNFCFFNNIQLSTIDILYDLGCGDGRFLIRAALAEPDLMCLGIELNEEFCSRARRSIVSHGLKNRLKIITGDVCTIMKDYCEKHEERRAAAFVYLLPNGLKCIENILREIKNSPGGKVVSYMFQIPGWKPDICYATDKAGICKIYLYK